MIDNIINNILNTTIDLIPMPLSFYSANSKKSGGALFVSFNSKDGSGFFKLLQQTGWDAQAKKGSFAGGNTINIKLSQDEMGSFIQAVRTKGRFNFYHSFGNESTTGTFSYYNKKLDNNKEIEGFGLTIKKDNLEIKVGFSLGGAERLAEYFKFVFTHIFSAIYAADKKYAEENKKNKASNNAASSQAEDSEDTNTNTEAPESLSPEEDF